MCNTLVILRGLNVNLVNIILSGRFQLDSVELYNEYKQHYRMCIYLCFSGNYHYHSLPTYDSTECTQPLYTDNGVGQFLGVAMDGHPIYSKGGAPYGTKGLDACNGKTINGRYIYIANTDTFPYILGCFHSIPTGSPQTCGGK